MTAGHFGFAAVVKSRESRVPLWAIMLSTYLLDIVFIFLVSAGIESFASINPSNPSYGDAIIHAYYSHSLLGALIISIIAGIAANWKWNKRAGMVIGGVAFSHWILDLIVHRPDLPILPGNAGNLPLLGFGLWNIPIASGLFELVLVATGAYLYYKCALNAPKANNEKGTKPIRAFIAAGTTGICMLLLFISDVFSISLGLSLLLILLLIVLCGWLDSRLGWNSKTKDKELKPRAEADNNSR